MAGRKTNDCIFCKIVRGEIKSEIVKEGKNFIAFKDVNPAVEGHTLIVPKKHYTDLIDLPDDLGCEMLEFSKKVASELIKKKLGEGFNLIVNNGKSAGQFVMHAHVHIIPRKEGDGIRFLVK